MLINTLSMVKWSINMYMYIAKQEEWYAKTIITIILPFI